MTTNSLQTKTLEKLAAILNSESGKVVGDTLRDAVMKKVKDGIAYIENSATGAAYDNKIAKGDLRLVVADI